MLFLTAIKIFCLWHDYLWSNYSEDLRYIYLLTDQEDTWGIPWRRLCLFGMPVNLGGFLLLQYGFLKGPKA